MSLEIPISRSSRWRVNLHKDHYIFDICQTCRESTWNTKNIDVFQTLQEYYVGGCFWLISVRLGYSMIHILWDIGPAYFFLLLVFRDSCCIFHPSQNLYQCAMPAGACQCIRKFCCRLNPFRACDTTFFIALYWCMWIQLNVDGSFVTGWWNSVVLHLITKLLL